MNVKDIALLKETDIDGDFLQFCRAKTIRTRKKDQRPIKVALHPKEGYHREISNQFQSLCFWSAGARTFCCYPTQPNTAAHQIY